MTEAEARATLVAGGKRLLAEGLVARSWGNLSVRLDSQTMAVTPSGIPWEDLTEAMIVLVDLETDAWAGSFRPSGERKVHREIYRRRPEVQAVVHTHQNAASACAAARKPVPGSHGSIPCAPYGLPGTKKLTRGTVDALGQGPAVLMANHGVFTVGRTLDEAFSRIAALETTCANYLASQASAPLPIRADTPWNSSWLEPLTLTDGTPALRSRAPFTLAWAGRQSDLPALLDDLAQLAGPRVRWHIRMPIARPANDVVIVADGAVVSGPDAEALAMVVEKGARAALGSEGLGGGHPFPAWEAWLMRFVYRHSYSKLSRR